MSSLRGQVAVVTGAGSGIGRSEAHSLAAEGAHVVVNDVAIGDIDARPAELVASEITAGGGTAEANFDDISDWDGGQRLIQQAVELDGHLDILVCNAGIVRDRTLVNMTREEWDAVINVHLTGHFVPARFAAAHWRQRSRESSAGVDGRLITTSSEAGMYGHDGQINYSAAKAGIAAMTVVAGRELARYGVTANGICPRARTGMTEGVVPGMEPVAGRVDNWDPDNVAPFVTFLAGPGAADINGQIFVVYGGTVRRMQMWTPQAELVNDSRWTQEELRDRVPELANGTAMVNVPFEEALR